MHSKAEKRTQIKSYQIISFTGIVLEQWKYFWYNSPHMHESMPAHTVHSLLSILSLPPASHFSCSRICGLLLCLGAPCIAAIWFLPSLFTYNKCVIIPFDVLTALCYVNILNHFIRKIIVPDQYKWDLYCMFSVGSIVILSQLKDC